MSLSSPVPAMTTGREKTRHLRCAQAKGRVRRGEMSSHAHESGADQRLETALQTLRDHQHRITGPRRALLAILIGEHGPFTAEELHQRMEKGLCDLVTVYRCLTAMEELNIVRRCDFGDGAYRY